VDTSARFGILTSLFAISLLGGITGAAVAQGIVPFPGGDRSIQRAAQSGFGSRIQDSSAVSGVTVKVVSIVADTTETAVGIEIDGRQELGALAAPLGRPVLKDEAGSEYSVISVNPDQENLRAQTWIFPPFQGPVVGLQLHVDGIRFWNRPADPSGSITDANSIKGPFDLALSWSGAPVQAVTHRAAGSAQFGTGQLVVDSVTTAPTGLVVAGHLEGIAADALPDLVLWPPRLTKADGRVEQAVSGRSGFGPNNARFEFRFESTDVAGSHLSVPFAVSQNAHTSQAAEALRRFAGTSANVAVSLP
jgi:hypothetical protein